KFRVTLTDEERCGLRKMVSSGKGAARTLLQGWIVLQADASLDGMRYTDEAIAEALRVRLSTIHRVRQQCGEESFEAALRPRRPRCVPRARRGRRAAGGMAAAMCRAGGGQADRPPRHRGRHSTPLQTINRIRYNQGPEIFTATDG